MYLYNFTLIFSLSFRILRPPSSTITWYLFTSLSALCLSQSSYPCSDISTSDTHGIIRVRARQYMARNWPNLFILSWFPQRDGWSDWLSSAEEIKPGRWKGGREKGDSISQTTSLTIQFSWACRSQVDQRAVPACQSLAELSEHPLCFHREIHPPLCISTPGCGLNGKKVLQKYKPETRRQKNKKESIGFDDSYLFKRHACSPTSRSHSLGAHFVFSPIRIHQQSTLLHTPREH